MSAKTKTGTLARGFQLGKLGLSLMGSYVGYQAQNLLLGEAERPQRKVRFQQIASRRVRDELGALKGPAMKLGQILSMQSGALPVEALAELAQLQMRAPAMHPTLARAQFKSSLGKYPEDLFREFDPEPFAAASLGQVHRALTRNGEKVAVKIQYPAIRSAIENDFTLLRTAAIPGRLSGHLPAALIDEVQRGILEETDYVHEADNLEFFRKGLSDLAYVTVPRVYRELSGDRVITMSFVEGESFSDFLKQKPSQATRDLVGLRLAETLETQLQCLRAVHADQHPGNYLFQPGGNIGLIDFGCVKRLSFSITELRDGYHERPWKKSPAAERRFLQLLCGQNGSLSRARKILPLIEQWADLFFPETGTEDLVIDYRNPPWLNPHAKALRKKIQTQLFRDKLINPEFIFASRAEMGLGYLLHELGATINLSKIWRRIDQTDPRPSTRA